MRKWFVLIDVTILITALLVLVIDWQIKQDILQQAKSLQEVIGGQGAKATDSNSVDLSGGVLRGDDSDLAAVAGEARNQSRSRRTRSTARSDSGSVVSIRGNADPGIPAEDQ